MDYIDKLASLTDMGLKTHVRLRYHEFASAC